MRDDHELAFLLGMTFQLLISEFVRRLDAAGYDDLRPIHGYLFQALQPHGATASEIAERLGVTKQATGQIVDQLEGLGYVRRQPHPLGGRRRLITLTERGQAHMRVAGQVLRALEQEWAEEIGPDRMASLRRILNDLLAKHEAQGPLPPFHPAW